MTISPSSNVSVVDTSRLVSVGELLTPVAVAEKEET
jgi:hypothetical protein